MDGREDCGLSKRGLPGLMRFGEKSAIGLLTYRALTPAEYMRMETSPKHFHQTRPWRYTDVSYL